ncbi:SulP family inorganic anion transporter [Slackia heliotrinireducens]|uniref:SulP family inorganic anion transporter n=1 Tax=Slackia heliotrinireducens TaxID=84110 RepID=UPI0033146328
MDYQRVWREMWLAASRRVELLRHVHPLTDIMAGLVVAALTIPVAMGYAQVAGLPPVYGLYGSIIPTAVYALLTRSRNIVFGMDSATVAATGGLIAGMGVVAGSEQALAVIPLIAFFSAIFLIILGVVGAGRVMRFVPMPVMHGFIAGIAVVVIVGQFPKMIGLHSDLGSGIVQNISAIAATITQANSMSVVLGVSALVIILITQHFAPRIPVSLIVLVVATFGSWFFDFEAMGVDVLGSIPAGLPDVGMPDFTSINIGLAALCGLLIALVSACESLLTVDIFAMKHDEEGNENHELIAFGFANLFSAFIGSVTCSASLSRTLAGDNAGARSQVVSIAAAAAVLIVVLFAAPVLYFLPEPVLAAIVIDALITAVEFGKIIRYCRKMAVEFLVFLVTGAAVVFLGAAQGVIVGVAMSFLVLFLRQKHTDSEKYLGVVTVETDERGGVLVTRDRRASAGMKIPSDYAVANLSGMISFMNIHEVEASILDKMDDGTDVLILNISEVTGLDTTATDRLVQLLDLIDSRGVEVRIVRALMPTLDRYTRSELKRVLRRAKVFPNRAAALKDASQADSEVIVLKRSGVSVDAPPDSVAAAMHKATDMDDDDDGEDEEE